LLTNYNNLKGTNVTNQIASDTDSRGNFSHIGVLNGQLDSSIRAISDNFVFAISRDLGTIRATQDPVVWAIGYTTDEALSAPGNPRIPYYKLQYWNNDNDLASIDIISCWDISNDKVQIVDFLKDFSNAYSRAQNLDSKILHVANSVTDNLGDLVSASIAQVFGSMQITIGIDVSGGPFRDTMIFMKNIGGVQT
jgi:hypothetical protein